MTHWEYFVKRGLPTLIVYVIGGTLTILFLRMMWVTISEMLQ